jgi:NAD(P)-dependent dehydrogenase (short-subunit alcohol dehydrogenase family)
VNNSKTHTPPITLVTGASAGIGRSAAIEIARRETGVIVTYRTRADEAARTLDEIRALGGRAHALRLDLTDSSSFPAFVAEVTDVLRTEWDAGQLTAIVNNGGFGGGRLFEEMTEDAFDAYYRALFRGPYFLTQALLPLLADGGSIVSVSSSSPRPGDTEPGYSAYAGMKAGLIVASRFLAKELGPRGIRVNTVAPGPTRTRIGDDAFAKYPELADGIGARTALGRLGEPEDIGRVIAFLVSDDSAWITGEDIQVAGGYAL